MQEKTKINLLALLTLSLLFVTPIFQANAQDWDSQDSEEVVSEEPATDAETTYEEASEEASEEIEDASDDEDYEE